MYAAHNAMETPIDEDETIRRNCVRFREELGVSQQELAARSGLDKASIYRYETGRSTPNLDALRRHAEATGHNLDDYYNPNPPRIDPTKIAAVRFKVVGPLDDDLRARVENFMRSVNQEQAERTRAAKERGRRGKKL